MTFAFERWGTVTPDFERPSAALIEQAGNFGSATLHEAGAQIGALPSAIRPVDSRMSFCGPAFTIHSPPRDNLWLHRGLALAKPGDVLVVYVSDFHEAGYWGEIMSTAARERGLAGLVIDGCVRDADLLWDIGFPVFSRGLCIRGTGKDFEARGWINHPLRIGEITVNAGDLVRGDRDGVVVLPREQAAAIVAKSAERESYEAEVIASIERGQATLDIYGWNR